MYRAAIVSLILSVAAIRDVAVAPDGAVWLIEDADPGRLLRLSAPAN